MKRALVLSVAVSAATWLITGCGKEEAPPPPRVHHTPKPEIVEKSKPVKAPKWVVPGTAGYLDSKNGFRDAVLGVPSGSFSDLVLKAKDDTAQTATYTRSGDDLTLNGVPLQEIDYIFFRDQLAQIAVKWKVEYATNDFSIPPSSGVAADCTKLYGRPQQGRNQRESTQYTWAGQRVKIDLDEMKLPGVATASGDGTWAIAPVTTGQMVVQSIPLCRDMDVYISSQSAQGTKGGL